MHPKDKAGAVGIGIGLDADFGDLVGVNEEGLELERQRETLRFHEAVDDGLGVGGDLFERAFAIEMLRTADEPDFRSGEIDEGHGREVASSG